MKNITIEELALYFDKANQIAVKMPDNVKNLKIVNATLKVKTLGPIKTSNYQVKFLSCLESLSGKESWLIDQLNNVKNGQDISINISDELQYCLDNSINFLKLGFEGKNNIEFNSIGSLKIDFIDKTEFQGNGNKYEIDLGRAGTATVNLVSGTMLLATPLISFINKSLPFSISINYSSIQNNIENNTGLPKGWTLNLNQFLVKQKLLTAEDFLISSNDFTMKEPSTKGLNVLDNFTKNELLKFNNTNTNFEKNKEKALSFSYLDGMGKSRLIEEKYYVDNKQVDRENLSVDLDGNIVYIDNSGITHKVITKLEAPSGLTLVSSIKDLKGANLVDFEPNKLAQQRNDLKAYKKNLKLCEQKLQYYKKQLVLLSISRSSILKQILLQETSISSNEDDLKFYGLSKNLKVDALNKQTDEQKALAEEEFKHLYGEAINKEEATYKGAINYQSEILETNKSIYCSSLNENTFRELLRLSVPETFYKNVLKNKHLAESEDEIDKLWKIFQNSKKEAIDDCKLSDKDIYNCDIQINELVNQYYQCEDDVKELQDLIKKCEHNLAKLEMQVPIHYLYDENNIVYGFGKTDNKDVFRLILMADANNSLFFNYSSIKDNKIKSISNSKEVFVTFNYNENNLLTSIKDARNKLIKLNYDNNNFIKSITFADNFSSYFYYNKNNLTTVINQSGFGVKLTYTNNKVSKINAISILNKVEDGKIFYKKINQKIQNKISLTQNESSKINTDSFQTSFNFENADFSPFLLKDKTLNINYNNYKSTTITNARNKAITYNFDKYGNTITTYENKNVIAANNNSTKITEYIYSNNLLTEKITKFINSKNYLKNVYFSPNRKVKLDKIQLGKTTCGDGTSFYEEEIQTSIFKKSSWVTKPKTESVTLPIERINDINLNNNFCSHKVFIVSGWAKANSAFIIVDENEKDFDDYIKSRKFEIRVEVTYEDNSTKIYSKPFDWRNTSWQYCAVPIKIESNKNVATIICYLDYSNNTGSVYYTNLDFYEGDYEHIDYNNKKQPKLKYSGHSKWQTEYVYNEDNNKLIEEVVSLRDFKPSYQTIYKQNTNGETIAETLKPTQLTPPTYITTYEYDNSNRLLKTTNYNGIIIENVYDDKGRITKTLTYHKTEPTNIFYEEYNFNEDGNNLQSNNVLGEKTTTYEYIDKTNIIASTTNTTDNVINYGYNNVDLLLQASTNINGIENANTYGYNLNYLTSLKHNNFEIAFNYDDLSRTSSINIAGNNYLSNEYKVFDNYAKNVSEDYNFEYREETTTLANGEIFKKVYNENNNLLKLFYKSSSDFTEFCNNDVILENTYDKFGNLIKTVEKKNNKQLIHLYSLDKFSNPLCEEIFDDNLEDNNLKFKITNAYDDEHNKIVNTTIKIENEELNYKYKYTTTPDKTLENILLPNNFNQSFLYDKLNRLECVNLVNNNRSIITKKIDYLKKGNHASNLVSALTFTADNQLEDNLIVNLINDRFSYKYDVKGNITEVRQNNNLIARYNYDSLSRLIREDNKVLNFTKTFFYDAGGNITQRKEYSFTLANNLDYSSFKNEFNYHYPIYSWNDQLLKYNNQTFFYDELGNPTTYRDKQLKWSCGRQLDKFDNVEFKYNVNGVRTAKIVNDIYTKYLLNGNIIISQTDTNNTLYFYYGANGITAFKLNGIDYLYKKNFQNDIISICNTNGQEIVKYFYDAWGNHSIKILNNKTYVDISTLPNNNDFVKVANLNPFRYRSYYYDNETKLYYLNNRYYDSELGRFINADNIGSLQLSNGYFNGINLYAYCLNNPLIYSDYSRNFPINNLNNNSLINFFTKNFNNNLSLNYIERTHTKISKSLFSLSNPISKNFDNISFSSSLLTENGSPNKYYAFSDLDNDFSSMGVGIKVWNSFYFEVGATNNGNIYFIQTTLYSILGFQLGLMV